MKAGLTPSIQHSQSKARDLMEESLQDNSRLGISTPSVDLHHACYLADAIFALEEPWRGRFVELIARRVRGWEGLAHSPSRSEVARWLCEPRLYNLIRLMLRTWNHER